ncbi:MAG: PAS domain S-box protein [Verrucomicrobiota bacterium]|nr:PAS domain S-box protein [Verrucomicrobiota bacterium]
MAQAPDITDAHLSEAEYRLLWETSTDAVVILDRASTIRYANPAVADIFGYRPDEVVGQNIALIQPERLREGHRRGLGRYLSTGQKTLNWRATEALGLHRQGHEFPIEIAFSHLAQGGEGDLFAAFIRDISARKQTEEALRVGQERMTLVLEGADVGLWFCPLPFSTLSWDERVKQHFWLSADAEVTIDTFYEQMHRDDRERVCAAIEQSIASRTVYETEFRTLSAATGATKWIRAIGRAFYDEAGIPVGFDGLTIDVTEKKAAEVEREELLSSERAARTHAERTSRMKDEFLATLSHELRTPLNAILGWSQILGSSNPPNTEDLTEGLKVIERNARVQTQLIEDLLDMSRIISGKVRLDVQHVDVAAAIEAAIASVAPAAEAKGIRIQKVLDPLAGPVMGDAARLQQVLWNLVSNALKFTPKAGRVQVVLERVNSHLEIVVSDTGVGIQPEFLPHVFERFRQADATTTRRHGGLGLGLAIVKHLVEMHGGTVRAASPGEGLGSTFTVHLPLAIAHQHEPVQSTTERLHPRVSTGIPAECPPGLEGAHVLVVDDEPDSRDLVKRILQECAATVQTAASAEEGLAALDREQPDVLISDIGMPGTDGYQFMRSVRALSEEKGGRIPAIALTAFARSEDRQRAMLAGFDMHVAKPVEPAELIAVVARLARRV